MTSLNRRRLLKVLAGATTGSGFVGTGYAKGDDRYIVGTKSERASRAAKRRADSIYRDVDLGTIGHIIAGHFPEPARKALEDHAGVKYIEPDGTVEAIGETLPWGVDRVDADVCHTNDHTGKGADIAILDTGIDSDHPDLEANIGVGYAIESCSSSSGCNYAWDDDHDHGTHCAGIADAVDNGQGVIGVSTEATLHAVKVLDRYGSGSWSGIAEGLKWVADQGYDVGSMSFGASSDSNTIQDACQYASNNGVLLVAAAGNDGSCSDCVLYPAKYSTVVAVSATNSKDELAYYSSTGPEIELAAPGSSITSTATGGDYKSMSGTSMACPHVSGAGGQLMANGYTHTEARSQLQDTAEDIGLSNNEQGYGLLDAEAAVGSSDATVAVSTDGSSNIGENSFTAEGSLVDLGGASSADVSFDYRKTDSTDWMSTSKQTLSSTGSFDETVSGLESGTDYEFRAVATASDGDSDQGSIATLTTTSTDTNVAVTTDGASAVDDSSATLDGTLTDLGGASSVDVSFEWRETGASSWNKTSDQTLSSTGSFSENITNLSTGTEYEFRAVASASDGNSDTGTITTFTTTSETSGDSTPVINSYSVTEAGSPNPHAEITADWGVSDSDGDLMDVLVMVQDSSGDTVDKEKTNISGTSAAGTNVFKIKHAKNQTFDVILRVTDGSGHSEKGTQTISE